MADIDLTLPFNYTARPYQRGLFNCIAEGCKRACAVWHRRAGKDKTLINLAIKEAFKRIGAYYYFFPTYRQGRKILWDGIDRDGFRFLDHIPESIRVNTNNSDMKINLINGSLFQVIGTDNIDSIVGTNPVGCVFSEYALQDPRAWEFTRPILRENGGWAVFNYTPRGHNHGYDLYNMAKDNPDWFCQKLTVEDTGVITPVDIEKERKEGMSDDLIRQEFHCSFEASIPGAYYANEMALMREQGRICRVAIEPSVPVNTYWDLGIDDSTTIWCAQVIHREIHAVNYYSNSGEGLVHYANYLKDWRDRNRVTFGAHVLPHDGGYRQLQTGKTSQEFLREYAIECQVVARPKTKESAIETSRQMLALCYMDEANCANGIEALTQYRKEFDEENRVFKVRPVHDIHSHGADGFQTLALYQQREGILTYGPSYADDVRDYDQQRRQPDEDTGY